MEGMLRRAQGVVIVATTPDPDAVRGAYEVAHALAGNLKYLRRRPAAARTPDSPPPPEGTFDVVDAGAGPPPADLEHPLLLIAPEGATSVAIPPGWVLGVIARARPVPVCDPDFDVLGVFPPLPGDADDPMWLGKAADHLESRVDLWPVLQVAAPG